ncbi:MAG: hypothetical protein WC310_01065 [Patescibacteria group bacterium]|jgi:hypothetical protein
MKHKKSLFILTILALTLLTLSGANYALARTNTASDVGQPGHGPNKPMGEKSPDRNQHRPGVMGKISAISGTTITITGKQGFGPDATEVTYTVDTSGTTVKEMTRGEAGEKPTETTLAVSDLKVDDMIMVHGEVDGTNVTAAEIMVGQPGHGPMRGDNNFDGPGPMDGSNTNINS